jgi:hypothetical protein
MPEAKYLRLDADAVAVIVQAFNHSKMSWWPEEQHAQVKSLVRELGRYQVATAEELREDFEQRGRKLAVTKAKRPSPTITPDDFFEGAMRILRGRKL